MKIDTSVSWSDTLLGTKNPVIEIFRAGDYPQGYWDNDDLDKMVANYDVSIYKSPVTLDHSQAGAAMGWIQSIFRQGDTLYGIFESLQDAFVTNVREKRYVNRSIEVFELEMNGVFYWPYLKAVTFLGAQPPQVKGLAEPNFDALPAGVTYKADKVKFFSLDIKTDTSIISDNGGVPPNNGGNKVAKVELTQEQYDQRIKDAETRGVTRAKKDFADSDAEAKRTKEFADKEAENVRLKEELRTERNKGFDEYVDGTWKRLLQDGKVLPAEKETFENMCKHLSGDDIKLDFSADMKQMTPLKAYVQTFENMKARVPVGERIKVDPNGKDDTSGDKKTKHDQKYENVKNDSVKRQNFIDEYLGDHYKDAKKGTPAHRSALIEANNEAKKKYPVKNY